METRHILYEKISYLCLCNSLIMKDITTELTVPPYLFDWLVNKYGNPLRFPARSPHNDLLHALVAVARPKQGGGGGGTEKRYDFESSVT